MPQVDWTPLTTANVVQIGTTAFLALIAFVAPYLVWRLQREYLAPRLRASYDHKEPMARLSSRSVNGRPTRNNVYDFHFLLRNVGETPAKNVVAEIVEFWYEREAGVLIKLDQFLPVYLRYQQTESVDIHPKRPYYWNIGDIHPSEVQQTWDKATIFDAPGKRGPGQRFRLDLYGAPHNQTNALLAGEYGLKIVLYSENAKPAEIRLLIKWSGKWRATAENLLNEMVIEQVRSFP